jgi:hypothetical protein
MGPRVGLEAVERRKYLEKGKFLCFISRQINNEM